MGQVSQEAQKREYLGLVFYHDFSLKPKRRNCSTRLINPIHTGKDFEEEQLTEPLKKDFIDSPEVLSLIQDMLNAKKMDIKPSDVKKKVRLKERPPRDPQYPLGDIQAGNLRFSKPNEDNIPDNLSEMEFLQECSNSLCRFNSRRQSIALSSMRGIDFKHFIKKQYKPITDWANSPSKEPLSKMLHYLVSQFSPWLFYYAEGSELYREERIRLMTISDLLQKLEAFDIFGSNVVSNKRFWRKVQDRFELEISGLLKPNTFVALEPLCSWIVEFCDQYQYDKSTILMYNLLHLFGTDQAIQLKISELRLKKDLESYLSKRRKYLRRTRLYETEYDPMFYEDYLLQEEIEEWENGPKTTPHPLERFLPKK